MNDPVTTVISTTLGSAGLLAEVNLIRQIASDWLQSTHSREGRRLRPAAHARSHVAAFAIGHTLRAPIAAAILCGVMPSLAVAQVHANPHPSNLSTPTPSVAKILAHDELKLDGQAKLTLQSPPVESAAEPLVISADRPGFSESTGIVPAGRLQLEAGYSYTLRDRDGTTTHRSNAPEVLARFGLLSDRLELRLSTSGYVWSRSKDGSGAGFDSSGGWSDLAVGFKVKVCDQDRWLPRLALDATTTLGVGSDGTSSQIAEPALKALWSYDLGTSLGDAWSGVTLGGNVIAAWPTSDGNRFTQGQGSIYLAFPIVNRFSGFAEYYVIGPNSKGTDAAHYVDCGGAYLLTDRVQLDVRIGFGLNKQADNVLVGVGISFLF